MANFTSTTNPKKPFTLYWSNLALYEGCPQAFLWGRGWGTIDSGGGMGRKKPLPVRKLEHHAMLGVAIQYAIEKFYNDQLWQLLDPETLKRRLLELADEMFRLELAKRYVDWRAAGDREDLEKLVREGVMGYMRTMKHHRFLGPYAKAEVELLGYVDKWTPVGGRADVIIRRQDTGVTILDGKNSKRYKDPRTGTYTLTHTDPDQLRWDALLFHLTYGQYPDRLGFVYYRYPYGAPILDADSNPTGETETGVDWVPYTKDDLKGLAHRAQTALRGMDKERFEATPSPNACKFCDYESVCPERKAQKDMNRRTPRDPKAGPIPLATSDSDGVAKFSM